MNPVSISKQHKTVVSAADAARWNGSGKFVYTRKYDGQFVPGGVQFGEFTLVVEHVRPKSGGKFTASDLEQFSRCSCQGLREEFYAAYSLAAVGAHSCLDLDNLTRWNMLKNVFKGGAHFTEDGVRIVLADSGVGGEFFDAVRSAGGEGVVAVPCAATWGFLYAAKPWLELYPIVTGKDISTGCIEIADASTFQPLGRVPARAHFDMVRTGDIVEIHCLDRHTSGKLREARFVCVRNDKFMS